jgi:hypothetical protein
MIRTMIDSDQLTGLHQRADIGAVYADLLTPVLHAALLNDWQALAVIDRGLGDPLGVADLFDVERGTLTPDQAAKRYDEQHARLIGNLAVYANRDTFPAVDAAMGTRPFGKIYATLDGTADIPGFQPGIGPTGVQVLNAAMLGFHADLSLVFDDHWHPSHPLGRARSLGQELGVQIHWLNQRLAEIG